MLRGRFIHVIFLSFLVLGLVRASDDDEPAQCPETSQPKTSSGDDGDDQQPCVAQLDVEPTDEASGPTPLSLDESDDEAGDTSPLAGTYAKLTTR